MHPTIQAPSIPHLAEPSLEAKFVSSIQKLENCFREKGGAPIATIQLTITFLFDVLCLTEDPSHFLRQQIQDEKINAATLNFISKQLTDLGGSQMTNEKLANASAFLNNLIKEI